MVDFKQVIKGLLIFVLGYFLTITSYYIVPPILNSIPYTDQLGLTWFVMIVTWVLGLIIIPAITITKGIQTQEATTTGFQGMALAALFFLFMLILTYVGWFWIEALSGVLEVSDPTATMIMQGVFYIGLFINWILGVVIAPATKIIKSSTHQ